MNCCPTNRPICMQQNQILLNANQKLLEESNELLKLVDPKDIPNLPTLLVLNQALVNHNQMLINQSLLNRRQIMCNETELNRDAIPALPTIPEMMETLL
jgi:hypothetical protein